MKQMDFPFLQDLRKHHYQNHHQNEHQKQLDLNRNHQLYLIYYFIDVKLNSLLI
jgi:hypothetical protein